MNDNVKNIITAKYIIEDIDRIMARLKVGKYTLADLDILTRKARNLAETVSKFYPEVPLRIQYTGENKAEIEREFGVMFHEFCAQDGTKLLAHYPITSADQLAKVGDYIVSDLDFCGCHVEPRVINKGEMDQMINKYKPKQETIEAIQWTGDNTAMVRAFCPECWQASRCELDGYHDELIISYGDAPITVIEGDYIIKTKDHQFYAMSADRFRNMYELLED